MPKSVSQVGQLIDMTPEEFVGYCKGINYGELMSIKILLELEYQRIELTKNGLIQSINEGTESKALIKPMLEGLYVAMQKVEDRCVAIEETRKGKGINGTKN
jgi:hypothetical protein